MVHLPMLRLIGPDIEHQIPHRPLSLRHPPIVNSDIGYLKLRIRPFRKVTSLDLFDDATVRVDGLFLEITHKAVASSGGEEVRDEHAVKEDALRADNEHLHEPARLGELEEGKQMHALVVGLLKKGLDPEPTSALIAKIILVPRNIPSVVSF